MMRAISLVFLYISFALLFAGLYFVISHQDECGLLLAASALVTGTISKFAAEWS